MIIKYTGGRSWFKVSLNRKPYYFNPENDRILETKDESLINYIFSLPNKSEFRIIEKPVPIQDTKVIEEVAVKPVQTNKLKFKKGGK